MIKKIFKFATILAPWFLSSLIQNANFIDTIKTPDFTPPKMAFPIIWSTLYILIAISIYNTINKRNKKYTTLLIINYIANQLFNVFFFSLNNLLLSFIDCVVIAVTAYLFYIEVKKIKKEASYFLIPYFLFSIFATILSFTIFVMNL